MNFAQLMVIKEHVRVNSTTMSGHLSQRHSGISLPSARDVKGSSEELKISEDPQTHS